jgi:TolB-like protein/Tfp pilus assembly protein PilF
LIRQPLTTGIAVLPFENLSDDKEHAFFADGVQDDILIKLAKIGDLKVISRTSVMQYRGKQDVRQIGDELRVSHILEGTVRRSGGKVHVNAQLVDTRTDAGIWAEEFDRDLNDVFAIETEVAQSIANRLRAKVSAGEKMAMQEWPTKDLVAYDSYVRAVSIIYNAQIPSQMDLVNLSEAVDLLNAAVARDPNFFLAYCQLAFAHDLIYQQEIDHTPARLALTKSAIDSAFRLRPASAEAHLALSWNLYWGHADFERARAELARAKQHLPNNARAFELAGLIDRRQGRWADATQNLERACELDPRNLPYHITLATTYLWLHDYDQEVKVMDHIIALRPDRGIARIIRASIEVDRRADTGPMRAVIEKVLTTQPGSDKDPTIADWRLGLALDERDFDAAASLVAALPLKQTISTSYNEGSRDFWLGVLARLKGDESSARAAFMTARTQLEEELRVHPDDGRLLSRLGLIDAALGRKQEALSEGRRALEVIPIAQEAMFGDCPNEVCVKTDFAMICAWTGETELALEQLEAVTKIPGGPNYGELRLDPMWDPLRGDPRFEKIVNSLAPK